MTAASAFSAAKGKRSSSRHRRRTSRSVVTVGLLDGVMTAGYGTRREALDIERLFAIMLSRRRE